MLDTSTGTAEPCHHVLGRSTAISIFYLPLLSTSWIWVAWSVPTFGCLLAAVRNKGSACRTWRQLRGRWCVSINAEINEPLNMMLMVGSVMCHRREREADSQSEPDSRLGHSLSPCSISRSSWTPGPGSPSSWLACSRCLLLLRTLLQPFLLFNEMRQK